MPDSFTRVRPMQSPVLKASVARQWSRYRVIAEATPRVIPDTVMTALVERSTRYLVLQCNQNTCGLLRQYFPKGTALVRLGPIPARRCRFLGEQPGPRGSWVIERRRTVRHTSIRPQ